MLNRAAGRSQRCFTSYPKGSFRPDWQDGEVQDFILVVFILIDYFDDC